MKNINNTSKIDNSYVLSALSYLSIFFAPIVLPLFTWILADEPTSIHGKKALTNHIFAWICFFVGRGAFIFSKEIYDQLLISVIFIIITILFFLIALVLYVFNIIKGVKILLKK